MTSQRARSNDYSGSSQDKEYAVEDAKAWTLDLSNEIKAPLSVPFGAEKVSLSAQCTRCKQHVLVLSVRSSQGSE